LQRLHAFVTDTNMASTRVLLKCGFRQGQRQHRLVQLHGAWVDGYAFECTLWSA
jgi:RimJ/RimL family protein N-acetyltransferase